MKLSYIRENKERIPGGLSSGLPDSNFDQTALKAGTKVEMEHTDDPAVAKEIAKDHLKEDPKYYEKLKKMEGLAESKSMPVLKRVQWSPAVAYISYPNGSTWEYVIYDNYRLRDIMKQHSKNIGRLVAELKKHSLNQNEITNAMSGQDT